MMCEVVNAAVSRPFEIVAEQESQHLVAINRTRIERTENDFLDNRVRMFEACLLLALLGIERHGQPMKPEPTY